MSYGGTVQTDDLFIHSGETTKRYVTIKANHGKIEKTNSRAPNKYVSIEWALILLANAMYVNLTQLEQNDLHRILLKSLYLLIFSQTQAVVYSLLCL